MTGVYSGRHDGMYGNAPAWYLRELWSKTGIASVLALCQLMIGLRRRCVPSLILGAFTVSGIFFHLPIFGVND